MYHHLSRLSNIEFAIQDKTKEAKEAIRNFLEDKGNITDIEEDIQIPALLVYSDGRAGVGIISEIELNDKAEISLNMTNGICLSEDILTAKHILDIISIINLQNG